MAGPVPRNYPDIRPFLPDGWEVVKEKGGISRVEYRGDERVLDCHHHYLNCLEIARCDEEAELRKFAVGDGHE